MSSDQNYPTNWTLKSVISYVSPKSNIKEVSRFCSPEVKDLMKSWRPHYLPREFSSIFFIAVYLPSQTDAGPKTALIKLYKAISKQ